MACDEMRSTPSHEDDDTSESGAHAKITVDVFLVGGLRTDFGSLRHAA